MQGLLLSQQPFYVETLTFSKRYDNISIEKGKTSNGYAKRFNYLKITLTFSRSGGYFFMVNANASNKIIIKEIM